MSQAMEKSGVVMVMTTETQEKILADAGVFVPRINTEKLMSTCKYICICQNNPDDSEDDTLYAHRDAFLIGTISGVSASNANGDKLISFDTYAEIHKRNAWSNGPVRLGIAYYATPTEAKLRVGAYDFKPVKFAAKTSTLAEAKKLFSGENGMEFAESKPMTITPAPSVKNTGFDLTEAKALIAKALGIAIDQVEIIIKA